MYSINVFITFSMTEASMCWLYFGGRRTQPEWKKKIAIHVVGLVMCLTILIVTIFEKFLEGGWLTLVVTGALINLCFLIKRHYRQVLSYLAQLDEALDKLPDSAAKTPELDARRPTAVVLVAGYGGLGMHTVLNIFRFLRRSDGFRSIQGRARIGRASPVDEAEPGKI
jgi:K+ transporter